MKCPTCNQKTKTLETRTRLDEETKENFIARKRECLNRHVFLTEERITKLVPKSKTSNYSSGFTLSELWNF
jgi:transcriptional regulator NrdR family protein